MIGPIYIVPVAREWTAPNGSIVISRDTHSYDLSVSVPGVELELSYPDLETAASHAERIMTESSQDWTLISQ